MDGTELIRIQHSMATPLSHVGLQVWRGALLLADYVLHPGTSPSLAGCSVLELGAGPGLAGLVLAKLARLVFLTDVGAEVLANTHQNAAINQQGIAATVHVRQLDWLDPPDWLIQEPGDRCQVLNLEDSCGRAAQPPASPGGSGASWCNWTEADLAVLRRLDVLLAADCVYDDRLTDAFMQTAVLLMRYAQHASGRPPRLLVALERRIVFTLTEMEARAPAYEYWRSLFKEVQPPQAAGRAARGGAAGEAAAAIAAAESAAAGTGGAAMRAGGTTAAAAAAGGTGVSLPLIGWRVDVESIPQTIREAPRSEYVELWELALL
ncbi:Methyltransferase-like protein 22 [Chlorella vulgaris]